jgi:hypothetical protein
MRAAPWLTMTMLAYLALIGIAYTVVADHFTSKNFAGDLTAEDSPTTLPG